MKKIVLAVLFAVSACPLFAGNTSLSTYLLIDSFPEASAKGAASGVASYAVYNTDQNPASSAAVETFAFAAMHSVMPLDIKLEKISVVKNFDFGCMGLNLSYMDFGSFSGISADENLYPVLTGSVVTPYSLYGSILYGKKFDNFSVGADVKLIDENLSGTPSYSPAFDIGFIMDSLFLDDLGFGFSACNISNKDGDFAMPLGLKTALSYNIKNRVRDIVKITASADYLVYEQNVRGGVGFDYAVFEELVLRGGFTIGTMQDLKFTGGISVKAGGTSFSYAYIPDPVAGSTHKFSISGSFGKKQEAPEKAAAKGDSFAGYMQSGDFYYDKGQYRQAIKYYEYINLLYWKDIEDLGDREKSAFYQKLGICYYNIRDNGNAKQYFDRALYYDRENEILKHWIKSLKAEK